MQMQILLKKWLVKFCLKVNSCDIAKMHFFPQCDACAMREYNCNLHNLKKTQKYTKKHIFEIVSIWQKDNSKSHLPNYWNYPFKWFRFKEQISFLWKIFNLRNVFHEISIGQRIWYLKKAILSMLECTIRMLRVVSMHTTCIRKAFQTKTSIAYWQRKTQIMNMP